MNDEQFWAEIRRIESDPVLLAEFNARRGAEMRANTVARNLREHPPWLKSPRHPYNCRPDCAFCAQGQ